VQFPHRQFVDLQLVKPRPLDHDAIDGESANSESANSERADCDRANGRGSPRQRPKRWRWERDAIEQSLHASWITSDSTA
jgi:hypothetical protein